MKFHNVSCKSGKCFQGKARSSTTCHVNLENVFKERLEVPPRVATV